MAKGDHQRMQNQVDSATGMNRNLNENLRAGVDSQNRGLETRFNTAADRGAQDYDNLMGMGSQYYNNLTSGPTHNFGAYGGYQNFANTGGYSDQNISDIRARSVAPTRAIYANAMAGVDRQKALAGGYSPNAPAAKAKMARELSYTLGDQATNTEAMLAEAIRNGKLAGLGGMTNIDSALLNSQDNRLGMAGSALNGMANLYGTAPGAANMYGNQMLNSTNQRLGVQDLENDIMRSILSGQDAVSNTTGNFQSAMGNVGSVVGVASDVAGLLNPGKYGGKK